MTQEKPEIAVCGYRGRREADKSEFFLKRSAVQTSFGLYRRRSLLCTHAHKKIYIYIYIIIIIKIRVCKYVFFFFFFSPRAFAYVRRYAVKPAHGYSEFPEIIISIPSAARNLSVLLRRCTVFFLFCPRTAIFYRRSRPCETRKTANRNPTGAVPGGVRTRAPSNTEYVFGRSH